MRVNRLAVVALAALRGRKILLVLTSAVASALLAGCGSPSGNVGPIGRATYAGGVQPIVGQAQPAEPAVPPAYALVAPPGGVAVPATSEELGLETRTARPAQPSTVPQPSPQVAATPQQNTPTRPTTAPPPFFTPVSTAPAFTPAIPGLGPDLVSDQAPRVIPDPSSRGPRPTTYPNLADVPETPSNLPTADETAAIRAELEADRDAINRGEEPPSVAAGSIMQSVRERLEVTLTTPAAGGTASVTFEAGSAALTLSALATLQDVARSQAETGQDVRLVGFAYADNEANRPVALGIALDRANTVASVLVSYGADPSALSVFASALTGVSQQNAASSRRVDITFQ